MFCLSGCWQGQALTRVLKRRAPLCRKAGGGWAGRDSDKTERSHVLADDAKSPRVLMELG